MPIEAVTNRCHCARPVLVVVPKPVDLACVLDECSDVLESSLLPVNLLHQVRSLADCLQQPELDAVVDEFHEVTRSGRARVDIATLNGKPLQRRLEALDQCSFAARFPSPTIPISGPTLIRSPPGVGLIDRSV